MAKEKSLFVTDFDDTLVHTDSRIAVVDKDGKKNILSPAEYAEYEKKPGDTFDYSEFEQLTNPRPIKRFVDLLKKILKEKKADKVVVLTARGHTKPIAKFLKSQGIESGIVVAALGDSDPIEKAKYIEKHIKDGYKRIVFIDDAPKNVKAVDTLKDKYSDIKLVTHQVTEPEETKSDKTTAKEKIEVRPIETKEELAQVKDWIFNKHYIARWPSAVQAKLGIYIDGKLSGTLLYGATIRPQSGTELFKGSDNAPVMQNNQMWELLRAYTTDDAKKQISNLGSMVIAKGNEYIRTTAKTTDGKPVKAILTYADADVGHTGGVYKATNASYIGKQKPQPVFVVIDPKTENEYELRTLTKLGKDKLEQRGLKITKRKGEGKHKYVYPLGKDQKERDTLLAQLAVSVYEYPTGKEGEISKQIPNAAKDRVSSRPQQKQQNAPETKSGVIRKLLNSKVKNPETGNDILVKTALKYDKNHPSYKQAKGMVSAYAKKHNIRLKSTR